MTTTLAREWTDRLRSGRYTQCHGLLRNGAAYCAMGVLGDAAVDRGMAQWLRSGAIWDLMVDGSPSRTRVPSSLLAAVGIDAPTQTVVTALNDVRVPLDVIAGFVDTVLAVGFSAAVVETRPTLERAGLPWGFIVDLMPLPDGATRGGVS